MCVPNQDFSVVPAAAQGVALDVIGLANSGGDTRETPIKASIGIGLTKPVKSWLLCLMFTNDVHAWVYQTAKVLSLTRKRSIGTRTHATRAWSDRFKWKRMALCANMVQGGVYSSTMAYLCGC